MSLATTGFDTIYIGQKVVGCFGGYAEKIILIKNNNKVNISYRRNHWPEGSSDTMMSDSIFNRHFNLFITKANKLFPRTSARPEPISFSTIQINTYLRNGNTVYTLPQLFDWKGYDEFKQSIGIRALN